MFVPVQKRPAAENSPAENSPFSPLKCYRVEKLAIRVWQRTAAASDPVVVLRWKYGGLRPNYDDDDDLWTLYFEFWASDWPESDCFSDILSFLGTPGPEPQWEEVVNALKDLGYEQDQDHVPL